MWLRWLRYGLTVLVLSVPPLLSPEPARAYAAGSCTAGAYVTDVWNVDPEAGLFSARVWLWTVCPDASVEALQSASLPNADVVDRSAYSSTPKGGRVWSEILLQGTFKHRFDASNFPFDRDELDIVMTAPFGASGFHYVPDTANSTYDPKIAISGWRITGYRVTTVEQGYPTNFGDPTLSAGEGSRYSRLYVRIDLARADPTTFWRVTGPMFIAWMVSFITFLLVLDADGLDGPIGALGAALFAVMLNLQQADSLNPSARGLSLVDRLHLLTMLYIVVALGASVTAWRATRRGQDRLSVRRLLLRTIVLATAAYFLGTGWFIWAAARQG